MTIRDNLFKLPMNYETVCSAVQKLWWLSKIEGYKERCGLVESALSKRYESIFEETKPTAIPLWIDL